MALDREAIHAALYARLKSLVTGLNFTSRLFLDYDSIPAEKQPAMLVLAQSGDSPGDNRTTPSIDRLEAMVIFYVRSTGRDAQPETLLLGLIKKVEEALAHQTSEPRGEDWSTSLGALCRYVLVSDYQIHHGVGPDQAAATIRVQMVAVEGWGR